MGAGQNLPPAKPRPHGSHACANRPEKRDRGGLKGWSPRPGHRPVPHAQKKAPPVERISKWPESKDVAEGRAAMREVPVLALGGPQAAAIVPG